MEKRIEDYDVVVIGGGAGGMTAALYAGRARLKTLLMEKSLIGGLATYTSEIENYPGFPEGIDGTELMKLFDKQFRKFGVNVKLTDCKGVTRLEDGRWNVSTFRTDYHAKAVVISTGGRNRLTGAPGEEKYLDKGISFCATCDAARYTGKKVLIIGSGDAAIEEGMFLTRFCSEVWVSVVHDEGHVDANEVAKEKAFKNEKMHFIWNTSVDSFEGDDMLKRVKSFLSILTGVSSSSVIFPTHSFSKALLILIREDTSRQLSIWKQASPVFLPQAMYAPRLSARFQQL